MTLTESHGSDETRVRDPYGGMIASWSDAEAAIRSPPSVARDDLPTIVANISPGEIAARISAWRAANAQLDALFREDAQPARALRRLALTHWAAGDPRLASTILATAAALSPDTAALWLDLGFTLQAVADHAGAARVFERSLALDPAPARAWLGLAIASSTLGDKSRAETAFLAALARDSGLHDAIFGLGLLCFDQRRYAEAAEHWRAAIAGGCRNPTVHAGLGQSLFFLGDFAGAAVALERALASAPVEPPLIRRFALARYLEIVIVSDIVSAEAAYRVAAGSHAEALAIVARSAFQILSGYGHRDPALRLARERLSEHDDDPIQRYLIDAVAGEKLARAPRDYIVACFDRFAEGFDKQLVDVLQYRVPEQLMGLIDAAGQPFARAVDLGCGTGLAGPLLRANGRRLVGVDLSPRMLAKAAERRIYDALIEAEMTSFLERTSERFDLIFAADALVYLGDLQTFFSAAARVAPTGGLVAFNIETTERAAYLLLPSGRFAHSMEALLAEAAPWFELETIQRAFLRIEADKRVHGALVLLKRRRE